MKVPRLRIAGALTRSTIEGFLEEQPDAERRCMMAIGREGDIVGPNRNDVHLCSMALLEALARTHASERSTAMYSERAFVARLQPPRPRPR